MSMNGTILVWIFVLVSTSAWSNVFVHWTSSALPPAKELGLNDLVLSWNDRFSAQARAAQTLGYRVYVEVSLGQAATAAGTGASGFEGIILTVRQSERAELEKSLPKLRSAHPKVRFLVLNPDGKQPEMRGSQDRAEVSSRAGSPVHLFVGRTARLRAATISAYSGGLLAGSG